MADNILYGEQTTKAVDNFAVGDGRALSPRFIAAFALVKRACCMTNGALGYLGEHKANAITAACEEIERGEHHAQFVVHPYQGGAGTSTNMNANEVIAARATQILQAGGATETVDSLADVNMHQSTNDVYPTALRVAMLFALKELETKISDLQAALQQREHKFKDIVRVGRTQLQDAVPMTLGMTFGAWAEAIARDRWRIFKCRERIKQVNLGGTATGTGLGAPRNYIFKATENLRNITGLNISRAENLVDATQNIDTIVEAHGMLKAYGANLLKIATDLRLMASGPNAGFGEIHLPALQAGSSIMPGKVNPVIPEMVSQIALRVIANDGLITQAAAMGTLELSQFLPAVTEAVMETLALLLAATDKLNHKCITGITPDTERCKHMAESSAMIATVLVPYLGYDAVAKLLDEQKTTGKDIAELAEQNGLAKAANIRALLNPKRLYKLGFTENDRKTFKHGDE